MKTPAEVVKENFWIGAKGGLVDRKHYLKMGDAVWLFLYLLREQTALNERGEGIANYGHPKTFQQIGDEMKGIPAETIRMWAAILRRERYIRTESHGHAGLIFWIAKGKPKTRKVKVTYEEAKPMQESGQKLQRSPRCNLNGEEIPSHGNPNGEGTSSRSIPNGEDLPKSPQHVISESLAEFFDSPTPKGSTSESLSYYNKESAAQTAASVSALFKKEAKKLQPPRPRSAADLDVRRRELLLQAGRIKRDYPAKGSSPRRVLEMQPQEAIA
jgi:SOS-response transcriptional repressor LexA